MSGQGALEQDYCAEFTAALLQASAGKGSFLAEISRFHDPG